LCGFRCGHAEDYSNVTLSAAKEKREITDKEKEVAEREEVAEKEVAEKEKEVAERKLQRRSLLRNKEQDV